LVVRYVFSS
jgi:hypothetical protein